MSPKQYLLGVLVFGAVVLACMVLSTRDARSETRQTVTILYTINNYGYIDPCG